jgi:hypothetical protein
VKIQMLVVAVTLASTASAAPNIANSHQKGSLLIFPDIRIDSDERGTWNTIIRLSNDGHGAVTVLCYWKDGTGRFAESFLTIAAEQAIWFDARTGNDRYDRIAFFPYRYAHYGGSGGFLSNPLEKGWLACFAAAVVQDDLGIRVQLKWNHLSGTATVYHSVDGAYEYQAYAFVAPTGLDLEAVRGGGTINLNGVEYDACPQYLMGQLSPVGAGEGVVPVITGNRLAIVSCESSFHGIVSPSPLTALQFDVWNEDGVKFGGASDCAANWHETTFEPGTVPVDGFAAYGDGIDVNGANFSASVLGMYSARYRVQAIHSARCDKPPGIRTKAVGLLGVQSTFTGHAVTGTTLATTGKMPGRIWWNANLF